MAMPGGNPKNLRVPTSEEARIIGAKGGRASQAAQKRRKNQAEIARIMVDGRLTKNRAEKVKAFCDDLGDDELTNAALILAAQMNEATKGSTKAAEFVFDLADRWANQKEKKEEYFIPAIHFTIDFIEPYRVAREALAGKNCVREIISRGGRGGIKSSFWASFAYETMMNDPLAHVVFTRRYNTDLRDSVYSQFTRTIDRLGNLEDWTFTTSPMRITYKPTGQMAIFVGCDKPMSKKSFELPFGYVKLLINEECDEMKGIEQLEQTEDTFLRKDTPSLNIKIYNPPKSKNNFMNAYTAEKATWESTYICHSYYYNTPVSWLGERFFARAEEFKLKKPLYYRSNYLGEVIGTGGELFGNVTERRIRKSEVANLPTYQGIDWGYEHPQVFVRLAFDADRDVLYVLKERYVQRANIGQFLKPLDRYSRQETLCDRDPNKIADAKSAGWNAVGATKYWKGGGRDYSWEWLRNVGEIVIDPALCPNLARELRTLEFEQLKSGEFSSSYPDIGEDGVMAACYAMNRVIMSDKKKDDYNDYEYPDMDVDYEVEDDGN